MATFSAASRIDPENTRALRHVFSVILREPLSLASTIAIILFIFVAIFAFQIAPYPEEGAGKTNAANSLLTPSPEHWFGTDKLGRDVLIRVIVGARPALIIPILVVLFAVMIGAPLGALAGYKGGWLDEVIMPSGGMELEVCSSSDGLGRPWRVVVNGAGFVDARKPADPTLRCG